MTVTATALEAALDGTGAQQARILRSNYGAAVTWHLVAGNAQAGGRTRWCNVTDSSSAAAQAVEVLAVLNDGY